MELLILVHLRPRTYVRVHFVTEKSLTKDRETTYIKCETKIQKEIGRPVENSNQGLMTHFIVVSTMAFRLLLPCQLTRGDRFFSDVDYDLFDWFINLIDLRLVILVETLFFIHRILLLSNSHCDIDYFNESYKIQWLSLCATSVCNSILRIGVVYGCLC